MTTKALARAIAIILAIATLAGCATVTPAKVSVTFGIYSGRPDPTWELSDAEAADVVGAISALPVVTGVPPQGGLGYHGYFLLIRRAGQPDETLVAYRGTVASVGGGSGSYRADAGRTVERLLLETGRSVLTPAEIAELARDLSAAP
jgi:hypothetical protein